MYLQLTRTLPEIFIRKKILMILGILGFGIITLGLLDSIFQNSKIAEILSREINPRWYIVFLGFPHIFASLSSFTIPGHINAYPKKDWMKLLWVIIICIIGFLISPLLFSAIFLFLVSTHIAGQSVGMLNFWGGKNQDIKFFLKWTNSFSLMIALLNIYTVDLKILANDYYPMIINLGWVFSAISLVLTFLLIYKSSSLEERAFTFLTQINLFGMFYFPITYSLFLGLMLLIVNHDAVAFYFYIVHRINNKKNILNCSMMVLTSILLSTSFVIAMLFFKLPKIFMLFQIVHYLVEKEIWKRDSYHRKSLKIA